MEKFRVEELPEIDQHAIKRGMCPWCLEKLTPGGVVSGEDNDVCYICDDEFVGTLMEGLD